MSFHLFASTTLAATVQAFLPCLADIATYTIDRKPQTNTQTIKHKQTNKLSAKQIVFMVQCHIILDHLAAIHLEFRIH